MGGIQTANDARLEALESKGYAPEDLVEKVDTINADLVQTRKDLEEAVKKANRPQPVDGKQLTDEQIEHKAALVSYLRSGKSDGLHDLEAKALLTNSDPDGGYLVDDEMDAMIDRVASTISTIRSVANVRTIGAASYTKLVKTRGISGGWLEENAAASKSRLKNVTPSRGSATKCSKMPATTSRPICKMRPVLLSGKWKARPLLPGTV
jgi:HK97 family phage major capsid protein